MSPILVRPVREQLEHDRVIRLLQTKFRRRFDVAINPGAEQNAAVGTGPTALYPDVVLTSAERGRRVHAVIEVETAESVNHLEALAQWTQLGRLRAPFHLYIPAGSAEVAKRLCSDNHVPVAEIQSYHIVGEEMRFIPVYKAPPDGRAGRAARPKPSKKTTAAPAKRARSSKAPTSKTRIPARKASRRAKRK